jgi:hypothetical protein
MNAFEQVDPLAAIERSERRFDPDRFAYGAEGSENRVGLVEQLPRRSDVFGALAQRRSGDHRLGEIVSRADLLKNPYCRLDVILRGGRRFPSKALPHQPTRPAFIMKIARRPACAEQVFDQGSGHSIIAAAEVALRKPNGANHMSPAHARTLKPGKTLAQFRDPLIRVADFDFSVTANYTGPRDVARDGCQRQRLVAAL